MKLVKAKRAVKPFDQIHKGAKKWIISLSLAFHVHPIR